MKNLKQYLRIVAIVIIALEALALTGCNTVKNTVDINSSYDAIKATYVNNPNNSDISFIYDAINNKISEYPKTVPDFINLPVDCIIDAIVTDERMNIKYTDDDNYQNGVIIAQEPNAGTAWDDGVIVNLTVNRKYSNINSQSGYMSISLDKLYLLTKTYNRESGIIWAAKEKLIENEIIKLYVDNGNVYYGDRNGVNIMDTEGASQVLGKNIFSNFVIYNEKIYFIDGEDGVFYCYNMNDKTSSLIYDETIMHFHVNSDYIICHKPHDIFILDAKSYIIIKHMHYESIITDCSLDNDNVYILEMKYISTFEQEHKITKYNIKQDEQVTIFDSKEMVSGISAIDDKLIYLQYTENQVGFRYIDMRNMENKFFAIEDYDISDMNDNIYDILFDGQRIIYEKEDQTFYSICIFTGETKEIVLVS